MASVDSSLKKRDRSIDLLRFIAPAGIIKTTKVYFKMPICRLQEEKSILNEIFQFSILHKISKVEVIEY